MKKLILALVLVICGAAGAAMLAAPLQAQPDGRYEGGGRYGGGYGDPYGDGFSRGSNFPGGSWRESCRAPSWRGSVLFAQCRSTYDRWITTRIDPASCPGGRLINNDGRLVCEGSGGSWGQGAGWSLPGGSWRQTCRYPVMRGGILSAECQSEYGGWRNSSVDARQCTSGDISNENGRLSCNGSYGGSYGGAYGGGYVGSHSGGYGNGPGWNGGQYPGGTWSQSCRGASMQGDVLSAQCADRSGYLNGTSISLRLCGSNRVGNDNGRLVCEY